MAFDPETINRYRGCGHPVMKAALEAIAEIARLTAENAALRAESAAASQLLSEARGNYEQARAEVERLRGVVRAERTACKFERRRRRIVSEQGYHGRLLTQSEITTIIDADDAETEALCRPPAAQPASCPGCHQAIYGEAAKAGWCADCQPAAQPETQKSQETKS